MLSDLVREKLLGIARASVEAAVCGNERPALPAGGQFDLKAGVFVTLTEHGRLRGCIGRLHADGPLPKTVSEVARDSAVSDPRFSAVTRSELPSLEYEISVMTPLHSIEFSSIEVGRHGVQLELHGRRSVFLPQVAPQWGWTREEMLEQLCLKAGLAKDAWLDAKARFWAFEAEVFPGE